MSQSKKFIIIESAPAATTYAIKEPKCIGGTTKPANEKPGKVNAEIVTLGKSTVKIYKRIAFKKNEKRPRVTRFKGSENMFKTGLINLKSMESTSPAKRRVFNPPVISTPAKTSESIKRDIALKIVLRRIVFITKKRSKS